MTYPEWATARKDEAERLSIDGCTQAEYEEGVAVLDALALALAGEWG